MIVSAKIPRPETGADIYFFFCTELSFKKKKKTPASDNTLRYT